MAPSKLVAYVYKKTNRITLVLVYASLEWTLIFLLLINSFFSYLLIKFASHFGLKKPCLLCSRIDSLFEPQNPSSLCTSLVCESHAAEIGRLGYCSNHRKLVVESKDLCSNCSVQDKSQKGDSVVENNGVGGGVCSCCGLIITHKDESCPSDVINDPLGVLGDGLISKSVIDQTEDGKGVLSDGVCVLESKRDGSLSSTFGVDVGVIAKNPSFDDIGEVSPTGDAFSQHLEFYIKDDRLVPVKKLVDSVVQENEDYGSVGGQESERAPNQECLVSWASEECNGTIVEPILQQGLEQADPKNEQEPYSSSLLDSGNIDKGIFEEEVVGEVDNSPATEALSMTDDVQEQEDSTLGLPDSGFTQSYEDAYQITKGDTEVEVGPGELVDQIQTVESSTPQEQDDPPTRDVFEVSTGPDELQANSNYDPKHTEEDILSSEAASVEVNDEGENGDGNNGISLSSEKNESEMMENNDHDFKQNEDETEKFKDLSVDIDERGLGESKFALSGELTGAEEEKTPDTLTRVESIHQIEKKLLLLARNRTATEESLDGSIVSEIENGDGDVTVEQLESALRAERKALRTLYAELEDERNAAAVAANQTMAMINRLQEEKAAMQMEALHNQRMMEEQAEYDQEALQMLNEVIVKREMEKQELEKELEIYKKKVMEYEERERVRILTRRRDGSIRSRTSSGSFSNAEESDGSSTDLNDEAKKVDVSCNHEGYGHQDETPVNTVLDLHDSLESFEEERLSILQQLKVLEEQLFNLADEEQEHDETMKPFEKFYEENGDKFRNVKVSGIENGFSTLDEDHHHQDNTLNASKPKELIPLVGAADLEFEDGEMDGSEQDHDPVMLPVSKFELGKKRLAIEEEMGQVYERLEALEADREFLKHCVGSLRKGDKGLDLLQEILQHLRDLKNVELQARTLNDSSFL